MEELLTTFSEYLFAAAVTVVLISLVTAAAFSLILTVAGGGISKISERRQRKKALAKTEGSYVVSGTIADAETITTQTENGTQYHHKYAVRYDDDNGTPRRAYLGITTTTPLPYRIGEAVPLRIFQTPVLQPLADAYDPARGSDGRLPGLIAFRSWLGRPVDETGTVMREEDFIPLAKDLEEQAEHDRSQAFRWFVLGGSLTVTAILLMSCAADSIISSLTP